MKYGMESRMSKAKGDRKNARIYSKVFPERRRCPENGALRARAVSGASHTALWSPRGGACLRRRPAIMGDPHVRRTLETR
jgi:hypothetical protein